MQYRRFGRTGHDVSVIGFGGAEIGVLETEQQRVSDLLNEMLDVGVNVIDTAAMYRGSEDLIGRAIGHRRDEYVLISKCGHAADGIDAEPWTPTLVTATVDRALRRLRTDALDVMLLHSCDLETLQRGDALGALIAARDAGKVRHVGYSGDNDAGAWAAAHPDIAVIETSINICDQVNIDQVLPACVEHDVGVLVKRPIANAAFRKLEDIPERYHNYASVYIDRLRAMALTPESCGFSDDQWAELALRFTLSQPGTHSAVIGTTNPVNVRANIEAANKGPLSDDIIATIREAFERGQATADDAWTGQT
ncbi:MAG: aldo/keto reductase [Planctomycetota bacterium]